MHRNKLDPLQRICDATIVETIGMKKKLMRARVT